MSDDIDHRIRIANDRLKIAKLRVRIRRKGDALYLRATLPPKPDSGRAGSVRPDLPTGLPASKEGLKQAENKARLLAGKLATKTFDWAEWLNEKPPEQQTIREWVGKLKVEYMATHSLAEATWERHWQSVYDALPMDERLTPAVLLEAVLKTSVNTRKRRECCLKLQKLADHAAIEIDLKIYRGNYNSSNPTETRELPTDNQIIEQQVKIPNPSWRWIYGVIATFGLRPHEAWLCYFIDQETLQVVEGKTGERQVKALFPEWVERWGLLNMERPKVTAKVYRDYGDRTSTQFDRYAIPFSPYDLRHAWAIRASITFRLPDTIAAKMMGHSVEVHNRTYHRWLSRAKVDEVYRNAIANGPKPP